MGGPRKKKGARPVGGRPAAEAGHNNDRKDLELRLYQALRNGNVAKLKAILKEVPELVHHRIWLPVKADSSPFDLPEHVHEMHVLDVSAPKLKLSALLPSKDTKWPTLLAACQQANDSLIEALLNSGADVHSVVGSWNAATISCCLQLPLDALLKRFAMLKAHGFTAFHTAVDLSVGSPMDAKAVHISPVGTCFALHVQAVDRQLSIQVPEVTSPAIHPDLLHKLVVGTISRNGPLVDIIRSLQAFNYQQAAAVIAQSFCDVCNGAAAGQAVLLSQFSMLQPHLSAAHLHCSLESGDFVGDCPWKRLLPAAALLYPQLLELILRSPGFDPNQCQDTLGQPLLHIAVLRFHEQRDTVLQSIRLLLKYGADPEHAVTTGPPQLCLPLMQAARLGHKDVLLELAAVSTLGIPPPMSAEAMAGLMAMSAADLTDVILNSVEAGSNGVRGAARLLKTMRYKVCTAADVLALAPLLATSYRALHLLVAPLAKAVLEVKQDPLAFVQRPASSGSHVPLQVALDRFRTIASADPSHPIVHVLISMLDEALEAVVDDVPLLGKFLAGLLQQPACHAWAAYAQDIAKTRQDLQFLPKPAPRSDSEGDWLTADNLSQLCVDAPGKVLDRVKNSTGSCSLASDVCRMLMEGSYHKALVERFCQQSLGTQEAPSDVPVTLLLELMQGDPRCGSAIVLEAVQQQACLPAVARLVESLVQPVLDGARSGPAASQQAWAAACSWFSLLLPCGMYSSIAHAASSSSVSHSQTLQEVCTCSVVSAARKLLEAFGQEPGAVDAEDVYRRVSQAGALRHVSSPHKYSRQVLQTLESASLFVSRADVLLRLFRGQCQDSTKANTFMKDDPPVRRPSDDAACSGKDQGTGGASAAGSDLWAQLPLEDATRVLSPQPELVLTPPEHLADCTQHLDTVSNGHAVPSSAAAMARACPSDSQHAQLAASLCASASAPHSSLDPNFSAQQQACTAACHKSSTPEEDQAACHKSSTEEDQAAARAPGGSSASAPSPDQTAAKPPQPSGSGSASKQSEASPAADAPELKLEGWFTAVRNIKAHGYTGAQSDSNPFSGLAAQLISAEVPTTRASSNQVQAALSSTSSSSTSPTAVAVPAAVVQHSAQPSSASSPQLSTPAEPQGASPNSIPKPSAPASAAPAPSTTAAAPLCEPPRTSSPMPSDSSNASLLQASILSSMACAPCISPPSSPASRSQAPAGHQPAAAASPEARARGGGYIKFARFGDSPSNASPQPATSDDSFQEMSPQQATADMRQLQQQFLGMHQHAPQFHRTSSVLRTSSPSTSPPQPQPPARDSWPGASSKIPARHGAVHTPEYATAPSPSKPVSPGWGSACALPPEARCSSCCKDIPQPHVPATIPNSQGMQHHSDTPTSEVCEPHHSQRPQQNHPTPAQVHRQYAERISQMQAAYNAACCQLNEFQGHLLHGQLQGNQRKLLQLRELAVQAVSSARGAAEVPSAIAALHRSNPQLDATDWDCIRHWVSLLGNCIKYMDILKTLQQNAASISSLCAASQRSNRSDAAGAPGSPQPVLSGLSQSTANVMAGAEHAPQVEEPWRSEDEDYPPLRLSASAPTVLVHEHPSCEQEARSWQADSIKLEGSSTMSELTDCDNDLLDELVDNFLGWPAGTACQSDFWTKLVVRLQDRLEDLAAAHLCRKVPEHVRASSRCYTLVDQLAALMSTRDALLSGPEPPLCSPTSSSYTGSMPSAAMHSAGSPQPASFCDGGAVSTQDNSVGTAGISPGADILVVEHPGLVDAGAGPDSGGIGMPASAAASDGHRTWRQSATTACTGVARAASPRQGFTESLAPPSLWPEPRLSFPQLRNSDHHSSHLGGGGTSAGPAAAVRDVINAAKGLWSTLQDAKKEQQLLLQHPAGLQELFGHMQHWGQPLLAGAQHLAHLLQQHGLDTQAACASSAAAARVLRMGETMQLERSDEVCAMCQVLVERCCFQLRKAVVQLVGATCKEAVPELVAALVDCCPPPAAARSNSAAGHWACLVDAARQISLRGFEFAQ